MFEKYFGFYYKKICGLERLVLILAMKSDYKPEKAFTCATFWKQM